MFHWFSVCFLWTDKMQWFVIIHVTYMYTKVSQLSSSSSPCFLSFLILPLSFLCLLLLLPFLFPRSLQLNPWGSSKASFLYIRSLHWITGPFIVCQIRNTIKLSSELNKQKAFLEAQVYNTLNTSRRDLRVRLWHSQTVQFLDCKTVGYTVSPVLEPLHLVTIDLAEI